MQSFPSCPTPTGGIGRLDRSPSGSPRFRDGCRTPVHPEPLADLRATGAPRGRGGCRTASAGSGCVREAVFTVLLQLVADRGPLQSGPDAVLERQLRRPAEEFGGPVALGVDAGDVTEPRSCGGDRWRAALCPAARRPTVPRLHFPVRTAVRQWTGPADLHNSRTPGDHGVCWGFQPLGGGGADDRRMAHGTPRPPGWWHDRAYAGAGTRHFPSAVDGSRGPWERPAARERALGVPRHGAGGECPLSGCRPP